MFSAGRPPASLPSDMCFPKTENCLVASSVGGSLSFLVFSSASLSFDSELTARSGYSFSLQVRSLLVTLLPLRQVFPWPAILPPRYPFSGALFFTPWSYYRPQFLVAFPWSPFRRPLFPAQPCPTGYLGGRIALFAALLYTCVFTALLCGRLFGGSAIPPPSCLLPPNLRPLPGAASGAYSSVAFPVGRLLDPFSCRLVDRSRGVGLFSTASLFVNFLHIRGLRSSRHLGVGTRAPRVLPPPSWDLSAIGN